MMNEPFDEDPADEGRRRAEAQRAHLARSAEATTADEIAAHAPISARLRAGQVGILGAGSSPQENAAAIAERPARVGDGSGNGRDLEAWGGFDWESQGAGAVGPVPARVYINQPSHQAPAEMMSPLVRHQRGLQ